MVAEMGFYGVDLTVRKDGQVQGESVKTDLPTAIASIKKNGIKCSKISTRIESVNNPLDEDIIIIAAAQNIKYYRPNWYRYKNDISMEDSLLFNSEESSNCRF